MPRPPVRFALLITCPIGLGGSMGGSKALLSSLAAIILGSDPSFRPWHRPGRKLAVLTYSHCECYHAECVDDRPLDLYSLFHLFYCFHRVIAPAALEPLVTKKESLP